MTHIILFSAGGQTFQAIGRAAPGIGPQQINGMMKKTETETGNRKNSTLSALFLFLVSAGPPCAPLV